MGLDSWTDSEEEDSFPWSKRVRTGEVEEGGDLKKEEELKEVEGEKKMEGDAKKEEVEEVGGDASEVMEEKKDASEAAEK